MLRTEERNNVRNYYISVVCQKSGHSRWMSLLWICCLDLVLTEAAPQFTRKDSVQKHLASKKHNLGTQDHACLLCSRCFARNDHVTQHLRQFHRVGNGMSTANPVYCFHQECHGVENLQEAGYNLVLASNAELHKHIRRIHKHTPFECPVDSCDRKGPKGWFRKNDRVLHQRKHHPDMVEVELTSMNAAIDATMPGYLAGLV
jgi:hypothetical protein